MCPAVTGVGIRFSSPPSAREVSARSADGGRDATRFLSPSRLCRQPPPRGGLAAQRRGNPSPFHKSPPKSQQLPAKFCAPIQNVKILPETVADGLRRCYIRPIHRKYTIYRHPWVSRVAAEGGNARHPWVSVHSIFTMYGLNIAPSKNVRNRFRRNFHILDRCTKFGGELL